MSDYRIVVSKYPLLGGIANHNLLVILDQAGNVVKELDGLATSANGEIKPIGFLPSDKLKVYEFNGAYMYDSTQTQATVFSGTLSEVMQRWNVALECKIDINTKNISYPFFGLFGGQDGGNSNSVASTLLKCMDLSNPSLPGWSPAQDVILLTPSEINQSRSEFGLSSSTESILLRDFAYLENSSNDFYGFNFDVTGYSSTGAEKWELTGGLRNEGFVVGNYSGSGLFLHADMSYFDVDEYSDLSIEGYGNDIDLLDHVDVDVTGDENWVDTKDDYEVVLVGESNSVNLWGLNGSVYANGWQVPYAPQDSIYDSANNMIDGYYSLLYSGDKRNPRSPTWPESDAMIEENEDPFSMVPSDSGVKGTIVGIPKEVDLV